MGNGEAMTAQDAGFVGLTQLPKTQIQDRDRGE